MEGIISQASTVSVDIESVLQDIHSSDLSSGTPSGSKTIPLKRPRLNERLVAIADKISAVSVTAENIPLENKADLMMDTNFNNNKRLARHQAKMEASDNFKNWHSNVTDSMTIAEKSLNKLLIDHSHNDLLRVK